MRSKFIQILLLFTMMFSIAHASIIAVEDHCDHETATEYVNEMTQSQECDDLCDIHHLFHLTAIITATLQFSSTQKYKEQPNTTLLAYHPPFKKTENKPPIA